MKKVRVCGGRNEGRSFLISVNVFPSCGPIRFIVHEGDNVSAVITKALRTYSNERRLPSWEGLKVDDFVLYSTESVLGANETIGEGSCRKFFMHTKRQQGQTNGVKIAKEKRFSFRGLDSWNKRLQTK